MTNSHLPVCIYKDLYITVVVVAEVNVGTGGLQVAAQLRKHPVTWMNVRLLISRVGAHIHSILQPSRPRQIVHIRF